MTPLCELAARHGTDKLKHGYTPLYHELFGHMRDQTFSLVEIGVLHGHSIRMWRDYFPHATIYAVDNNRPRLATVEGIPGVVAINGDAGDPATFTSIPDGVFIVIDDGSHYPAHQIAAFEALWPKVSGFYSVEDLHAGWAFVNGRHGFIDHLSTLLTNQARNVAPLLGTYPDVRFHRRMVIARKR